MAVSFWAVFCVIYGICTLLLPRKAGRMFVWHGFLAGMSVAFFCLHFLPGVFEQDMFYSVIAGVLGGVALGTAVEKHHPISGSLVCFWLAALLWSLFSTGNVGNLAIILGALSGGACLYVSCAAVLPEGAGPRECLWRGAGGVLGFWVGVWLDFMRIS